MDKEKLCKELFGVDIKEIQEDKPQEPRRDYKIQIRLTEDEKKIIKHIASCNSLDISNFIRWVIFKKYLDEFLK